VDMAVRQLPSSQAGQTTWLTPLHPLLVLDSFLQADYQPPSPAELAGWPAPVQFYLGRPLAAFAVITIGMSLALLGISAVFVRRLGEGWQLPAGLRRFLRIKAAGGERRRPARTVWHNPIAWREANTRAQGTIGILSRWAFATLAVLGAIGWILAYHFQALPTIGNQTQAQTFKDGLQLVLLIEIAVISLVAIYMAAGCISREREDGTLDLVLTTPVTPKYLVWGKLRGLIGFLSLLIAAPVLTVALVAAYSGVGGWLDWPQATMTYHVFGPSGGRIQTRQPLLLPEVALLFPMLLVPFTAFCVALGVSWSLKAKGVLGAILPSVGIIGVLSVVLGFCGYGALQVPLIGPILNAFSPTTNVLMLINPWEHVEGFGQGRAGEVTGRSSLVLAALICVAVYGGIVYGMILAMVRNFDQTVRRLSGTGG
ncbi:MAG: ABC transporter permease, partial [Phycisphaeraceae bacterium]|nr:ABC transporter permease [Phycisphaeraceae bacterium]